MARYDAPGWYGKLASQGDFAARRLPDEWVRACDEWLSACVADSQRQLGGRWLETYLNAPVQRFAWGPGVADEHWWFGVLMPSCDNVGRYFPLVVAECRMQAPMDRVGLDHLDAWWIHIARAALATLAEGASLAAFEEDLHAAPPWPGGGMIAPVLATMASGRWDQRVSPHATLGELALGLAAGDLQQRLARATFWWPLRSNGEGGAYTLLAGLPPPVAFAGMLAAI